MAFNRVILVGNLVADPELKTTPNGVSVTRFKIAVNRRFTRNGEQPQTDFFDIVAWRNSAEFVCKFFTKGKPILVSGSLQNSSWKDSEGNKRYATEVVADEVTFVEGKKENSQPANNDAPTYGIPDGFEEMSADDELLF